MLEELGLPYSLQMLPFPTRVLARAYLDINPLGTVPLMIHGSTRMTESAAICQYLCSLPAASSLQVEPHEAEYGAFLNFLHFGEATLTFPQTLVLRYSRFEAEGSRVPAVANDYTRWFLARLRTLDPLLGTQPYLCAQRFTAADVSVGYALLLAQHLGLAGKFTPGVQAYWQRLQQREGFRRAMEAQDIAAREQGVSPMAAPDTGLDR